MADDWRPAAVDAVAALVRWYARRELARLKGARPANDAPASPTSARSSRRRGTRSRASSAGSSPPCSRGPSSSRPWARGATSSSTSRGRRGRARSSTFKPPERPRRMGRGVWSTMVAQPSKRRSAPCACNSAVSPEGRPDVGGRVSPSVPHPLPLSRVREARGRPRRPATGNDFTARRFPRSMSVTESTDTTVLRRVRLQFQALSPVGGAPWRG